MKTKAVCFEKPFQAACKDINIQSEPLGPDAIIFKTRYSLVSAGTELAVYKGTEDWAPLPFIPGYASVGQVISVGESVKTFKPGDIIFSYSRHQQFDRVSVNGIALKIPPQYDLKHVVFTRIAAVSITALLVSPVELGDWVAVFGLGLVGNLAAQLAALNGANVIGVDIDEHRLELARQCGIAHTINPKKTDMKKSVHSLTGNQGVLVAIEATGIPAMVETIADVVARRGDIVLLGSPRGECRRDLTPLLNKVHLWDNGCLTLKGAHEWRYPLKPSGGCKHSIQRNCEILVELIARKRLAVEPLISKITEPIDAQQVYQRLLHQQDKLTGVLFDWHNV